MLLANIPICTMMVLLCGALTLVSHQYCELEYLEFGLATLYVLAIWALESNGFYPSIFVKHNKFINSIAHAHHYHEKRDDPRNRIY